MGGYLGLLLDFERVVLSLVAPSVESKQMQGADNNYAPPKAQVADVEPLIRLRLPGEVLIAVFLLYAVIGLIATGYVVADKRLWPPYFEYGLVLTGALWVLIPYFISGQRHASGPFAVKTRKNVARGFSKRNDTGGPLRCVIGWSGSSQSCHVPERSWIRRANGCSRLAVRSYQPG